MNKQLKIRALIMLIQVLPVVILIMIAIKNVLLYNGFYITTHGNNIIGSQIGGASYTIYIDIFWRHCFYFIYKNLINIGLTNYSYINIISLLILLKQITQIIKSSILHSGLLQTPFIPYFLFNELFILKGEYKTALIKVP